MTTISRSALVPHSATAMYELVADVDSYQTFLPWCRESYIIVQDEETQKATIVIAKGGLERSFTTLNRLQHGKMMEMRLIEGPFKHLEGFWRFQPLRETACKVSLDLDFEFSNRLMNMAFGKIFTQIANTLVDAFVKRAEDVYGSRR
jgi:ribosome-associated toxin RatA of RatAB toxin-antitoxin module